MEGAANIFRAFRRFLRTAGIKTEGARHNLINYFNHSYQITQSGKILIIATRRNALDRKLHVLA